MKRLRSTSDLARVRAGCDRRLRAGTHASANRSATDRRTKAEEAPKPTKRRSDTAPSKPRSPPSATKLADALSPKAGELGASDKPVVMEFVPSVDVSLITKGGTAMAECLSKMTGLTYRLRPARAKRHLSTQWVATELIGLSQHLLGVACQTEIRCRRRFGCAALVRLFRPRRKICFI